MTTFSRRMAIAITGLCGCWAGPPGEHAVHTLPAAAGEVACGAPAEEERLVPELALDAPAHSSSADQAANLHARCRRESPDSRSYRFTPPRTATYRFHLQADDPAMLSIQPPQPGAYQTSAFVFGPVTSSDLRATLPAGETYTVSVWWARATESPEAAEPSPPPAPPPPASPPVDLHEARSAAADQAAAAAEPPPPPAPPAPPPPRSLELVVGLDESTAARIRPEVPSLVERLIAGAPRLARRALGTFESLPGGPRARCGGLGGGAVYAIDVTGALALHVIAQFPVALEIRDRSNRSWGCARGEADPFEASLTARLPAGAYVVIVDAAALAPALLEEPRSVAVPGAGVRGGFALDAEVTP